MTDTLEFGNHLVAAIPSLRRYARSLTANPDDARTLVEQMLARGWQDRDHYDEGADLQTWLRRKALS